MREHIVKITNGKLITDRIVEKNLYIKDGSIYAVTNDDLPCDRVVDAKGLYVSPGFIDTHVHGGGGADFMDEGKESVMTAARTHLRHGTTTILPTTQSDAIEEIAAAIRCIGEAAKEDDMPHIYGVHMEGPWLSAGESGAMDPKYIVPPKREDYERLLSESGGIVKKVTFAPEAEGAKELFCYLRENGVLPTAGHTEATFDVIRDFQKMGLSMVTHLYSSMSTITRRDGYRILGTVEAAYYFDDLYTEVIADGIHLPKELLQIIYKIKGPDRICLITDAMRGADMPEGDSIIGSLKRSYRCVIEDGIAKMPDRRCFAGSVATADRCVRVFYKTAGVPLCEAVRMMTETPAVAHGMRGKGRIREGYDADLLLFDEDIRIKKVILKTRDRVRIYEKGRI